MSRIPLALLLFVAIPFSGRGDGVVAECTEAALIQALTGGGTVTFACDGTITLTSQRTIAANTVLDASGRSVTLSGNTNSRMFTVNSGVSLTLHNLTLANGRAANGGAIFNNRGTLVASNCTFLNNSALGSTGSTGYTGENGAEFGERGGPGGDGSSALGGAIYTLGAVTLNRCTFQSNDVSGGVGGVGGIGGTGTFRGGRGGQGGNGGVGYGGALASTTDVTIAITNCSFVQNNANGGNGGAGGTGGSGGSIPSKNGNGGIGAIGRGAGIYIAMGRATVINSTFSGNDTMGGNGAAGGTGGDDDRDDDGSTGAVGGAAQGGGIFNGGTNTLINCTFFNNKATGGKGGAGGPEVGSGFNGGDGGNGGNGSGGGLFSNGRANVTNVTFSSNGAYGGAGGTNGTGPTAGDLGQNGSANGGNIAKTTGNFFLKNSILAYKLSGGNASGIITDSGQNISSDATPDFTLASSLNGTDPRLDGLAANGGFTKTCALLAGSDAIDRGADGACQPTDQRGYLRTSGGCDIGAYERNGVAPVDVEIYANGPIASEDGEVGLFTIARYGGTNIPLTVSFTVSGTASNGVDYVAISNSVTIPTGLSYARVFIRALPDSLAETNETVTLTLTSSILYSVITPSASLTIFERSNYDRAKRYVRGTSSDPTLHSFVIPLDFEKGTLLDAIGGNAATLFPGNPWTTTLYHYNGTNPLPQSATANRIAFQNPVVAFGKQAAGSALYVDKPYSVGAYAGFWWTNRANAIRIQVYYRTNWGYVGTTYLPIPNFTNATELAAYQDRGWTTTVEEYGLRTTMVDPPFERWGPLVPGEYIFTHTASPAATNYFYVVEDKGVGVYDDEVIVVNGSGVHDWSKLYLLDFSPKPSSRIPLIEHAHFMGQPLPPEYQGKSLAELTNTSPSLPDMSSLVPANYLALDGSPELRRHPILDKFVSDMGSDPLALANYVINEIEITDALEYDTNQNSQAAIYLGGVDRSALATFQEEQGSPVEQCALLIYLLRQAGVPAAYVYPTNNGLQMLDVQLSKLLGFQLRGAVNDYGQTNLPALISVNYPWVVAYLTNEARWVHIFPWLKDVEVIEGFDLYAYMPTNYNSGYKWLSQFVLSDTNIFADAESDQPLDLLPRFIQKNLDERHPGLSVDDFGVKINTRRRLHAVWDDFPKPFALSGAPFVIESLKTNLNLFNTVQVRVYSQADTNKFIDTTELRTAEIHNRKLLLRFLQVGGTNAHDMVLSLAPFAPTVANQAVFSTNADPTWKLIQTNRLFSSDDVVLFRTTHRRLRMLPSSYAAPDHPGRPPTNIWNYNYFQIGQLKVGQQFETTDDFRKGDLVTLCLNVGRVTRKMLDVHAEEIWRFNRNADTNSPSTLDPEVFQGTTAYLLGMSYFEYRERFDRFNADLHKIRFLSDYQHGYGLLRPQRDTNGLLPNNGAVVLIEPAIDMPANGFGYIFNGSLHPDSGRDFWSAHLDWWLQRGVQASAAEHGILRGYYQTNAVSTIKLLQLVGANKVKLNQENYQAAGEVIYNGTKLKEHDADVWNAIENFFAVGDPERQVFITPGAVTNGTYKGVGALLFAYDEIQALVSGFNGGFSWQFPTATFSSGNFVNIIPEVAPDNATAAFILHTAPSASNPSHLLDSAPALWNQPATYSQIGLGQVQVDPSLTQSASFYNTVWGVSGTTADGLNKGWNWGVVGTDRAYHGDHQHSIMDPVNALTGEFYIDSLDLTLPGLMPLQIRRNYSSHNLAENEFGFGWKISYVPFLTLASNNLIYAAEMDGSILAYRQQAAPNDNLWIPTTNDNPTLNNNSTAGIGSLANLFNNRLQSTNSGGTNIYTLIGADGSIRTYTERSYPIGSFSRTRPYLDKWQDNRGNFYTFEYGTDSTKPDYGELRRIQASSGAFLGFYFDVYGHIVEAYTGDGRRLNYDYDKFGDLVKVTFPDQSEIEYEYQHLNYVTNGVTNVYSTHLIVRELKPDGRILQNDYDSQRRVTNQYATVGVDLRPVRNATFAYANNFDLNASTNLITGKTDIYDYTNRVTTYYYTNSLIRRIVDPLNQTITQDWYEADTVDGGYRRSLKNTSDKRGLQSTLKYDASGNVTNVVVQGDLTGDGGSVQAVSSYAFNGNNLLMQAVDPSGTTNKYFYTNTWLLSRVEIQPINATGGNIITNTFLYYNVTNPANAAQFSIGLRKREVRAESSGDSATTEWLHDYRSFVTNQILYTGTGDPTVTNKFFYNGRGELVERGDIIGRKTRFAYDARGRPIMCETFEAGQPTPLGWEYSYFNPNGELVWSDGPRFDPEDYVWRDHDGAGRQIQEIRWRTQAKSDGTGIEAVPGDALFATTLSEYDPFNNLTRTIDPRGVITTNTYDAIGQLKTITVIETNAAILRSEGFAYEPGGQVAFHTNALGGLTEKLYTSAGKLKYQKNPEGSTNAWRYLADGRLHREILQNGNYWEYSYDDANRKVTRIFKTNAVNSATNIVERDRRGNVIKTTDVEGFVSTNLYDGLDRIKVAVGPRLIYTTPTNAPAVPGTAATSIVQRVTSYFYDAAGQTVTASNAIGEKTITTSDALGRPVLLTINGSNAITARVTQTVYHTNHHAVTIWDGSGGNGIATTSYTDNQGQPVLTVRYPGDGSWDFTLQRYDAGGNAITRQEASSSGGAVTVWATESRSYDGLNRIATETVRDEAQTSFGYNALGNVTSRAMPNSVSWNATYNNAGQLLTEQLNGSGLIARGFTNAYYAANHQWAGLLQTVSDGRGVVRTNTYDAYLRLAAINAAGPQAEHNRSKHYVYDRRGLPTSLTFSNTGLSTAVGRTYDGYSEIMAETVALGSSGGSGIYQSWDNAGRRISRGIGGAQIPVIFGYQADGMLTNVSFSDYTAAFSYGDNGLLAARGNGTRFVLVEGRDGRGRLLQASTFIFSLGDLIETFAWRGDTRLTDYTAVRLDFIDTRTFSYAPSSRYLTQEHFWISSSEPVLNTFAYDFGQPAGLGVLTSVGQTSSLSPSWGLPSSGGLDDLRRPVQGTNTLARRSATGLARGAASVTAMLNSRPVPVQFNGSAANTSGRWRAEVDVASGQNTLAVTANHPSGRYTTNATSVFTNGSGADTILDSHDANGNVTTRIWKNSLGQTNRTQTLAWDAFDQLIKVTLRDSQTNGYDWSAFYDCLGRRVRTTEVVIQNGTNGASATTIDSAYDPEVEFLEAAVTVNGQTHWFVHGPDVSGTYGGMQGIGGLEAVVSGKDDVVHTIVNDHFGNVVADITGYPPKWHSTRNSAYGPVPGYQPPLLIPNVPAADTLSWLGKRIDVTGLYYFGARYYDPFERRFLSADPLGHAATPSLYAAFNGDPVNFFDPDGRYAKAIGVGLAEGIKDFALQTYHGANAIAPGGGLVGMLWDPVVQGADQSFNAWRDPIVSGYSPSLGNAYATAGFVGEVAPNIIPIGGLEQGAASVLARVEGWAARNAPVLTADLGQLAGTAVQWLDNTAPGLNPANYSFNTGRLFSGVPAPEYTGPADNFRVNLGGEGEVPGAINQNGLWILDPSWASSQGGKTLPQLQSEGHQFVISSSDQLPFRSGSIPHVIVNNVPIDRPPTHLGTTYRSEEIKRIVAPGGIITGTSSGSVTR